MTRYLTILSILVINVASYAQQHKLVGVVVNHADNTPIPYASVLANGGRGAVTNMDGQFLLIPDTLSTSVTLTISCIGFASATLDVQRLAYLDTLRIQLHEQPVLLKEIIVGATEQNAQKIMDQVINLLETSMVVVPYECNYFFRGSIKVNGHYTSFAESTGDWHSEGFSFTHYQSENHMYLGAFDFFIPRHARSALNPPWPQLDKSKLVQMPNLFSFYRAFRYLIPTKTGYHQYELEKVIQDKDGDIVAIAYQPKNVRSAEQQLKKFERNPGFSTSTGTYYIDDVSKAIHQIDFQFTNQGIQFSGIVKFIKTDHGYCRQYMKLDAKYKEGDQQTEVSNEIFWSGFEFTSLSNKVLEAKYDMLLQDVKAPMRTQRYAYISVHRKLKELYPGIRLHDLAWILYTTDYEKVFWDTYLSPPNPEADKIQKDLLKFGVIEKQLKEDKIKIYYDYLKKANLIDH